jgi:hypothetical protein
VRWLEAEEGLEALVLKELLELDHLATGPALRVARAT